MMPWPFQPFLPPGKRVSFYLPNTDAPTEQAARKANAHHDPKHISQERALSGVNSTCNSQFERTVSQVHML